MCFGIMKYSGKNAEKSSWCSRWNEASDDGACASAVFAAVLTTKLHFATKRRNGRASQQEENSQPCTFALVMLQQRILYRYYKEPDLASSHPRKPRAHQAGFSRQSLAGVGFFEGVRCNGPGLALLTNGGVQQQKQHNP
ncbi:hypothetical protein TNCV_452891 [Trichonephila clavipes]|nr:hypothetical protein TNCV_452891 [Trichonephila clavipes]